MNALDGVSLTVEVPGEIRIVTGDVATDRCPCVVAEVEVAVQEKGPSFVRHIRPLESRCQQCQFSLARDGDHMVLVIYL